MVEAALCGRPAVVTDIAGNTTIIEDMKTGFVADAPSIKLFDVALEKAWNNKDKWAHMGIKAYNHAIKTVDLNPHKTLLEILTNKPCE